MSTKFSIHRNGSLSLKIFRYIDVGICLEKHKVLEMLVDVQKIPFMEMLAYVWKIVQI